jgi:NAD(P)-dependent dehydrogenase (short-subunit alcohol dehydrogenase family)
MENSSLFSVAVSHQHHPSTDDGYLTQPQGKVVLVTGGAKGIGRMISEGFVQNGATVYVSSRDAKACAQACDDMNKLGKGRAEYIAADLYKEEDVLRIAAELKKREGSTSPSQSSAHGGV